MMVAIGTEDAAFEVTHTSMPSHTLSWDVPIIDYNDNVLPPGSCELCRFPMVSLGGRPAAEVYGEQL